METLDCGMPPNGKTASFSCTCSSKYTLESCIPKLILLTKLQQLAEYHCSGGKKTTTIKNKTKHKTKTIKFLCKNKQNQAEFSFIQKKNM